jgi:hypothetical protein
MVVSDPDIHRAARLHLERGALNELPSIPAARQRVAASPRQTVSDNLKAGITKACFHEPMVNRTLRRYGSALRHRHCSGAPLKAT